MPSFRILRAALPAVIIALTACSEFRSTYPEKPVGEPLPATASEDTPGTLFLDLFGAGPKKPAEAGTNSIVINAYLWRASLDTLSFMPLAKTDPFGGVIITDWFAPPQSPAERFKMSIFILDRQLVADALRVSVFRQVKNASGEWVDAAVNIRTAPDVENAILTRARELRSAAAAAAANKG
jgi:hypothetical protein